MFFKRSYDKEIMDDFSIVDERIKRALKELKTINKWLGGNSISKKGIEKVIRHYKLKGKIKAADIGSGASDVLLNIKKKYKLKILSVDLNTGICKILKEKKIDVVAADALKLPLAKNKVDIIHASLFFHHFNEKEIVDMLRQFLDASKYGVVINDLRRNILAFAGIKTLTSIFSKSEMVKHDGPLSVKRGFVKKDWIKIFNQLDIRYEIKRMWAFRWMIIIYKNN